MKLRSKLLFAQAPLAVALCLAGLVFVLTVAELGRLGPSILQDNYRSVLAAQRMKESVERIDSGVLFVALGERARGEQQIGANRGPFEAELRVEEENITEPGERAAAQRLRAAWTNYTGRLTAFTSATSATDLPRMYFEQLEPAFLSVKDGANAILDMNQDAMVRRSDRAAKRAASTSKLVTTLALIALLAGILSSSWLTSRLLRPLDSLASAVQQVAAGDLAARAAVTGRDELAEVAEEFNAMAEHLVKYRQSSLGALLQAQQASQAAIDSLPDPVFVLDLDSHIIEANAAANDLLRIPSLPPEQNPLAAAAPELRAAIFRVRDHVLGGKGPCVPRGFEEAIRLPRSEGDVYLLPRGTPLYGEERAVEGATVVLQDISRLRRIDELRNNVVATVAHEFRTPLTSLQMSIHLCLEEAAGPITERQADLLAAAREDCVRLQTIVNELLDLARLQSGSLELRKEVLPPRSLLDGVLPAFELGLAQKDLHLQVEVDPELPEIAIDLERAKIPLSNLMGNAIRHSPDHAPIAVRVRKEGRSVRFEVEDHGPGVSREHRDRVFDRFYRVPGSRTGGAGLGLTIAREIVEAHGGSIGIECPDSGGSRFWFALPSAVDESLLLPSAP